MSEPISPMVGYSTGDHVRQLVLEYCSQQRHPELEAFQVMPTIAWGEACPQESEGPGCYAIYGRNGWLLYVGMSVANVACRVRSHGRAMVRGGWFWDTHPPISFDVIPVREQWDAPSLEEFLTCKTIRYKLDRTG